MKDIKGYEELYAITSCGKVWSYRNKKFLKTYNNGKGYLFVYLCKNGDEKKVYVHRLVAETYISNQNNLPQVNHKDENPNNNCLNNLEWCDAKYNITYSKGKKIYCVETDTVYNSQREAADALNVDQGNISKVCRGIHSQTGGYHFKFYDGE